MRRLFWIVVAVIAAVKYIDLQRKLRAAVSRGDMYRDISVRLDRRLAELDSRPEAAV